VTVQVDPTTFLIRQVSVVSVYEKNPVQLTVGYQMVPQGPSYPAKVDLSYPKSEVQVIVENSNYQRLQAAIPAAPTQRGVPVVSAAAAP
jgi:hypothetical protein